MENLVSNFEELCKRYTNKYKAYEKAKEGELIYGGAIDQTQEKLKLISNRRKMEDVSLCEWRISIFLSFVFGVVLYLANTFHGVAHNASFRWCIFFFIISLFLSVEVYLCVFKKKNIKLLQKSEEKGYWTIIVFIGWIFLGVVISYLFVGNNWTWGAETKLKEGSILGILVEMCTSFTAFVMLCLVIKGCLICVRKRFGESYVKMILKISNKKIGKSIEELDAEQINEKNNELENMSSEEEKKKEKYIDASKKAHDKTESIKKELEGMWGELYEKAKNLTKNPQKHADIKDIIYLANFYEENADKFCPMRKIEISNKKPVVFLFDGMEKEGDEPEVLYDLVASVSMAFVCFNGKVELHFIDYIMNGVALAKEFGDRGLNVKRWDKNDTNKLFEDLKQKKEENSYKDNSVEGGKQFQIVNFVMLPNAYSSNDSGQVFSEDKWGVLRACGTKGIFPIFYIAKEDWDNPDNVFTNKLRDFYDGHVWYMKEQESGFDILEWK